MTEGANVDLVRRAVEAAVKQPHPDWKTTSELFHPDHELHSLLGDLEGGHAKGASGARDIRERLDQTGEWRLEIEDVREAPDGRVVTLMRHRMHSKLGDISLEQQRAVVSTLREGKICRTDTYATWAEALDAAGLPGKAMPANLDLVRSIFTAWECGDFRSVEWAHPEIEFVRPDGPEPGSWTGLDGMAEAWRDWLSVWEEFGNHADAYRELDDERVLVLTRRSGRGKASGLEIGELRTHGAQLFHVRNGMVTRYVFYFDRERALADLRLASEDDSQG